jgi:hypothetical protein
MGVSLLIGLSRGSRVRVMKLERGIDECLRATGVIRRIEQVLQLIG